MTDFSTLTSWADRAAGLTPHMSIGCDKSQHALDKYTELKTTWAPL
jgi:hypothetical protein